jgi:hypothetical protein
MPEVREMYQQSIRQLIDEVAEIEQFFRAGIVAIDITEVILSRAIERATKTRLSARRRRPTSTLTSGRPSS